MNIKFICMIDTHCFMRLSIPQTMKRLRLLNSKVATPPHDLLFPILRRILSEHNNYGVNCMELELKKLWTAFIVTPM